MGNWRVDMGYKTKNDRNIWLEWDILIYSQQLDIWVHLNMRGSPSSPNLIAIPQWPWCLTIGFGMWNLSRKKKVEVSQKEYWNSCLLLIVSDDVKYWNYTRKGTDSIGVCIYIYIHLALPATFSHSCGDFQVAFGRPLLQDGSHCRAGLKRPSSCVWKMRFEFEPIGIGG